MRRFLVVLAILLTACAGVPAQAFHRGNATFAGTPGAPPTPINIQFGDLTPAGNGCVPVVGTSMSGPHAADFQITTIQGVNCLTKAPGNNFAVDCASACSLTGNASQNYSVTRSTVTNSWDIAFQSEWTGTTNGSYGTGIGLGLQSTLANFYCSHTIYFRSGIQINVQLTRTANAPNTTTLQHTACPTGSEVVLESRDLATIKANQWATNTAWPVDAYQNPYPGATIGKMVITKNNPFSPNGLFATFTDNGTFINPVQYGPIVLNGQQGIIFRGMEFAQSSPLCTARDEVLVYGESTPAVGGLTFDWDIMAPDINVWSASTYDHTQAFYNGAIGPTVNGKPTMLNGFPCGDPSQVQLTSNFYTQAVSGPYFPSFTATNNTAMFEGFFFDAGDCGTTDIERNLIDSTGTLQLNYNAACNIVNGQVSDTAPIIKDNLLFRSWAAAQAIGYFPPCATVGTSCQMYWDKYHTDGIFYVGQSGLGSFFGKTSDFTGTTNGNQLTVGTINNGTPALNMCLYAPGVTNGTVAIVGGAAPNWTLSASVPTNTSVPMSLAGGTGNDFAYINGTISGTQLTVNSTLCGVVANGQYIIGSGITTGSIKITGGTAPNWTITNPNNISVTSVALETSDTISNVNPDIERNVMIQGDNSGNIGRAVIFGNIDQYGGYGGTYTVVGNLAVGGTGSDQFAVGGALTGSIVENNTAVGMGVAPAGDVSVSIHAVTLNEPARTCVNNATIYVKRNVTENETKGFGCTLSGNVAPDATVAMGTASFPVGGTAVPVLPNYFTGTANSPGIKIQFNGTINGTTLTVNSMDYYTSDASFNATIDSNSVMTVNSMNSNSGPILAGSWLQGNGAVFSGSTGPSIAQIEAFGTNGTTGTGGTGTYQLNCLATSGACALATQKNLFERNYAQSGQLLFNGQPLVCTGCSGSPTISQQLSSTIGTVSGITGTYSLTGPSQGTIGPEEMYTTNKWQINKPEDAFTMYTPLSTGNLSHTITGGTWDIGALGNAITMPACYPGCTGTTNIPLP